MVPLASKVGVHVRRSPGKVPVIFVHVSISIIFSTDLNKVSGRYTVSLHLVHLFHVDKQPAMTKLTVTFRNSSLRAWRPSKCHQHSWPGRYSTPILENTDKRVGYCRITPLLGSDALPYTLRRWFRWQQSDISGNGPTESPMYYFLRHLDFQ
jgi:hypothetical protein